MKLRGIGAVPRKRKRVALSSALAVFLTFTLAFSSFAWGAANDVSSTVFANGAISDIPAKDTQDSVMPGGENKTNETIEVGALSQESPVEGLDESAGSADDEAFMEESSNTGADGGIGAAAENEGIEPLAEVENVPYIDADGNRVTLPSGVSATVVTADDTVWADGWYIVNSSVAISERVTVSRNANLILGDGCKLTVTGGIQVGADSSFSIYSQTLEESRMGELMAKTANASCAGIGGSNTVETGFIVINGGKVYAEGGSNAAGIGGGAGKSGGSIRINNGSVEAHGGNDAAGIGGGSFGGSGGFIRINEGSVYSTGGERGAGFGGGSGGNGGTITINGGDVHVEGGEYGAGIGGGTNGNGGTISINGGAVNATGGIQGAGIGGGNSADGGTIIISGGLISARGNTLSCGIGGGANGEGGNITINGGNVSAKSVSADCAAIGGANRASGGNIALNGGFIDAQGVTTAAGGDIGPGIGNGEGGAGCTLSTTDNGSAFITTNMINGSEAPLTSCIYFIGANGYVRGDQTLAKDLHLSQSQALSISSGSTLRVPAGITLTNGGKLFDNGMLINDGAIVNNGGTRVLGSAKLTNKGIFTNNGALEVLGTLESPGTMNGSGSFSGNKATQTAPAAPQKQSATENSVTLVPITTSGKGDLQYGYSLDGAVPASWQTSNTFTGLSADTTYTFFARYEGNTYFEAATSAGTSIATAAIRSGHVENVTDASLNYLGADFVLPGDAVADAILPAYARKQLSLGKDVDIWMESNRITDGSISSAAESELGDFLPVAYFGLEPYWQVEGEAPVKADAETRDDAMVMVRLKLPDSAINTDPSITREYKVVCVYNGVATALITRYDPDNQTVEFRTNKFASFCLACKDTRDGKTVYPVMVRDSYAQDSGQGQYAAGDTVVVNAGARDGYMVEFWNGTPSDKIDFTIIDSSHASFVMPEGAVMVSPQWVRIGDISDVTDVEVNALQARLVNSGVDLAERVLPADAFAQLPALKDVDIWLKSVEGISDADAALVAENLGDWTLASEVDLTLFYKMDGVETQIHETKKPVTVQLTLPDSAINIDASKTRTYEVMRVHDGAISVIPATFDASAKTLTFETDRFSAYAIAYKDAAATTPGDEDSGNNGSNNGSANGSSSGDNDAAGVLSATGDSVGALVAFLLSMVVAVGILGASHRRASSAQKGKHVLR